MAGSLGLRRAMPTGRARPTTARTVVTRATIAEPVVVKREGTSHRSQSLILLSFGESAVRENRKRKTQKRRNAD